MLLSVWFGVFSTAQCACFLSLVLRSSFVPIMVPLAINYNRDCNSSSMIFAMQDVAQT